jgi:hypothetical protein
MGHLLRVKVPQVRLRQGQTEQVDRRRRPEQRQQRQQRKPGTVMLLWEPQHKPRPTPLLLEQTQHQQQRPEQKLRPGRRRTQPALILVAGAADQASVAIPAPVTQTPQAQTLVALVAALAAGKRNLHENDKHLRFYYRPDTSSAHT